MTDWTTARVTPEIQAELRRLLEEATPRPWHAWDRGIGFEVHTEAEHNPIRCDPLNSGFRETFCGPDARIIVAAVNALPILLDAAAERDALAAKVHAFETDDQKLSIMNGWLVYDVGEHTCGGYGPESNYMHEPGCGYEPVLRLDKLQGWPAAELDALNGQLFDAGYRCGELLAENRALAAKVGAVREWIDRRGVNVGDRDDDYMRGYRDAQRHAILDAAELRWILDAETGSES